MARWQDSKRLKAHQYEIKHCCFKRVLKEYNDNCNEAMVAKCVAPIADHVYEDMKYYHQ
jgi:hypothetical protein